MPLRQSERRQEIHTSRCCEIKIRGSAKQIAAKYSELADEARKNGERVLAETYEQHAHHWRGQ